VRVTARHGLTLTVEPLEDRPRNAP